MEAKTPSMIKAPQDSGTRSGTALSSIWSSSGASTVLEAASTLILFEVFFYHVVQIHKLTETTASHLEKQPEPQLAFHTPQL